MRTKEERQTSIKFSLQLTDVLSLVSHFNNIEPRPTQTILRTASSKTAKISLKIKRRERERENSRLKGMLLDRSHKEKRGRDTQIVGQEPRSSAKLSEN